MENVLPKKKKNLALSVARGIISIYRSNGIVEVYFIDILNLLYRHRCLTIVYLRWKGGPSLISYDNNQTSRTTTYQTNDYRHHRELPGLVCVYVLFLSNSSFEPVNLFPVDISIHIWTYFFPVNKLERYSSFAFSSIVIIIRRTSFLNKKLKWLKDITSVRNINNDVNC